LPCIVEIDYFALANKENRLMIPLRQIGFFVAVPVADALSFSRAAEACFVTQPALSAGIRELEDRLGAQLVERTRRSVRLTPLGKEIAARKRHLLVEAEKIETPARAHRDREEGDLRFGAILTIGRYLRRSHRRRDLRRPLREDP
jgi:LysR family hydrogen peroxide-inducible transcriptional activator